MYVAPDAVGTGVCATQRVLCVWGGGQVRCGDGGMLFCVGGVGWVHAAPFVAAGYQQPQAVELLQAALQGGRRDGRAAAACRVVLDWHWHAALGQLAREQRQRAGTPG